MPPSWAEIDRWLMGEAWVGSRIDAHLSALCEQIGVRWAGSDGEQKAAEYIANQLAELNIASPRLEPFSLQTSDCQSAMLRLVGTEDWEIDVRPSLFCQSLSCTAPLCDAGYGMPHEILARREALAGAVALLDVGLEPFSDPLPVSHRLRDLAAAGVRAVISCAPQPGRQLTHTSGADWRTGDLHGAALPLLQTSQEDGARLRRCAAAGAHIEIDIQTRQFQTNSSNVSGNIEGNTRPRECLILSAHHDTTPDSPGANDNAAGVAVILETARLLTGLAETLDVRPQRSLQFVSFGAEEQGLQGSTAFVEEHYGPDPLPLLMMNLDELGTGRMKGVVLQFPELRSLLQQQLNTMGEGLQCHVLSQLDASGDMFPFARRGIPAAFLWRWRFVGRHPEIRFGHSSSDTLDKVRVRELKEYAGLLARLLLRLAQLPGDSWPANNLDPNEIAQRITNETDTVFRTM
jgi:hypothetical protein